MTIDIGALRKFQETWAPVMDAIPAVVEMVERKADMEREVGAHRAAMEKAQAEIQKAYDTADLRIAQFNDDISRLGDMKAALVQEIADTRAAARAAAEEERAAATAQLAAIQEQTAQANAQLATVNAQIAAQTAEAQAAHTAAVSAMSAEIADLEKRRAAAEKALDALRAKLG